MIETFCLVRTSRHAPLLLAAVPFDLPGRDALDLDQPVLLEYQGEQVVGFVAVAPEQIRNVPEVPPAARFSPRVLARVTSSRRSRATTPRRCRSLATSSVARPTSAMPPGTVTEPGSRSHWTASPGTNARRFGTGWLARFERRFALSGRVVRRFRILARCLKQGPNVENPLNRRDVGEDREQRQRRNL